MEPIRDTHASPEQHRLFVLPVIGIVLAIVVGLSTYYAMSNGLQERRQERARLLRANCAEFCQGGSFSLRGSGECTCFFQGAP